MLIFLYENDAGQKFKLFIYQSKIGLSTCSRKKSQKYTAAIIVGQVSQQKERNPELL
jgi:hypothetical protein